jgi:hypothetical protein
MPDLLGKTQEERAKVQMLIGVLGDFKKGVTMPMYMNENRDEVRANAIECATGFFKQVGEIE